MNPFRTIFLLSLAFPIIASAQVTGENLLQKLPPGYKIEMQRRLGNTLTTQMVPESESLIGWKETLAVNIFLGDRKATVEDFQIFSLRNWKKGCTKSSGNTDVELIDKDTQNGYPFAMWKFSCKTNAIFGTPEFAWFKAIKGNDSFYVIQKSFKFEPSPEQIAHWIRYLEKVSVCDTRIPDRACPSSDDVGFAHGQEPKSTNESNSVLEERLRNAQVTERRLSNGAKLTEIKLAGSLKPNFELGCISMTEVTSQFNPPALLYAAKKCIQQDQYQKAWALMTTANGFAYYDLKRLADRSARGARTVMTMNAFADLTNAQREQIQKVSSEAHRDPEQVNAYCADLTRIGPPTYEPLWAILHGIGAYEEPRSGHYLTNVDPQAIWAEVLKNRCTVQK